MKDASREDDATLRVNEDHSFVEGHRRPRPTNANVVASRGPKAPSRERRRVTGEGVRSGG